MTKPEPLITDIHGHEGQGEADIDWLRGVAAKLADAIDGDHSAFYPIRAQAAGDLADALEEIAYDLDTKLNREAFLRRCGTPTLREKA